MSEFRFAQYLDKEWKELNRICIHINIDKIWVGVVKCHFCKFVAELQPFIDVKILFLLI